MASVVTGVTGGKPGQQKRNCFHPGVSSMSRETISFEDRPPVTSKEMIKGMLSYIWPKVAYQKTFNSHNFHNHTNLQDDPEIKRRVQIAMGLLVGAKLLNVCVPFIFKNAIDTLNEHVVAAGGEPLLSMATAPETVAAVGTSILVGCENNNLDKICEILREFFNIVFICFADGIARAGAAGLNELRNAVFAKVAQHSIRRIAKNVFLHLHNMDLAFHLSRQTGALSKVR